jgi:hypothetical protein
LSQCSSIIYIPALMPLCFTSFLKRMASQHRLARITIDEAHEFAIDMDRQVKFRPMMDEMDKLAALGVRLTLSTGTLPPSVEDAFCRHFGLQ